MNIIFATTNVRMWLGEHYRDFSLAGCLIGLCIALVAILARRYEKHSGRRQFEKWSAILTLLAAIFSFVVWVSDESWREKFGKRELQAHDSASNEDSETPIPIHTMEAVVTMWFRHEVAPTNGEFLVWIQRDSTNLPNRIMFDTKKARFTEKMNEGGLRKVEFLGYFSDTNYTDSDPQELWSLNLQTITNYKTAHIRSNKVSTNVQVYGTVNVFVSNKVLVYDIPRQAFKAEQISGRFQSIQPEVIDFGAGTATLER